MRSVSTTFEWKRVKMSRPPNGQPEKPAQRGRWFHLPARNWRQPLTLSVKYRGGAEGWVEVRARGGVGRYPGYTTLIEVLADANSLDRRHAGSANVTGGPSRTSM